MHNMSGKRDKDQKKKRKKRKKGKMMTEGHRFDIRWKKKRKKDKKSEKKRKKTSQTSSPCIHPYRWAREISDSLITFF